MCLHLWSPGCSSANPQCVSSIRAQYSDQHLHHISTQTLRPPPPPAAINSLKFQSTIQNNNRKSRLNTVSTVYCLFIWWIERRLRLKILQSPLSNHLHLRQTATALNQAVRRYQYQHQYDGGRHQSLQSQTQSPQHLPTSGVWTPGVTRAPPRVARSSVNIYQQYSTVQSVQHSTAQYSTAQYSHQSPSLTR